MDIICMSHAITTFHKGSVWQRRNSKGTELLQKATKKPHEQNKLPVWCKNYSTQVQHEQRLYLRLILRLQALSIVVPVQFK